MSACGLARRFASAGGFTSGRASAAVLAALFLFLVPAAADAYTLVLRSGRQVTVPDDFKVTPSAVVYEASPGFFVTVWLTNVDFAATERANAEPAGSFAERIKHEPGDGAAAPAQGFVKPERRAGPKVLTNKELEPSRLRRQAQEEEYERTRRERGMPSKQEFRRRIEEQDRSLRELSQESRAERAEAEADALKSELVNLGRELDELDLRLSQQREAYAPAYPNYYPYYYAPPVVVVTRSPFGHSRGFGRGLLQPHPRWGAWPYGRRQGQPSPTFGRPHSNSITPPPALAPAMPAPRR